MTELRQAAVLALDALELSSVTFDSFGVQKATQAAIAALRTALEQQAEQIGWAVQGCSKMWRGEFAEIDAKAEAKRIGGTCVAFALYTEPPQRSWVGLTDEEIDAIGDKVANEQLVGPVANFRVRLARAIEAKLKERNT